MPSLSNARANSLNFTHVWISELVVMEIFTKGPRTHTYDDPVYPVMTFSKSNFWPVKLTLEVRKIYGWAKNNYHP